MQKAAQADRSLRPPGDAACPVHRPKLGWLRAGPACSPATRPAVLGSGTSPLRKKQYLNTQKSLLVFFFLALKEMVSPAAGATCRCSPSRSPSWALPGHVKDITPPLRPTQDCVTP